MADMTDAEWEQWEEKQKADAAGREKELQREARELAKKYVDAGKVLGLDFDVVTTDAGNFVVRRPDFVVGKQFADLEKKTTEDVVRFAAPNVLFPEQMQARAVFQEYGGIPFALIIPLMKMYEGNAKLRGGK